MLLRPVHLILFILLLAVASVGPPMAVTAGRVQPSSLPKRGRGSGSEVTSSTFSRRMASRSGSRPSPSSPPSSSSPSSPSSFLQSLNPMDRSVLLDLLAYKRLLLRHQSETLAAHARLSASLSLAARTARERGGGGAAGPRSAALVRQWLAQEAQELATWLTMGVGAAAGRRGGAGGAEGSGGPPGLAELEREWGVQGSLVLDKAAGGGARGGEGWASGAAADSQTDAEAAISSSGSNSGGGSGSAAGVGAGALGGLPDAFGSDSPDGSFLGRHLAWSHAFCRGSSNLRSNLNFRGEPGEEALGEGAPGRGAEGEKDGRNSFPPTIPWSPVPGSFLLAHCTLGRTSNRLSCLRNHMLIASLLNRTLVVAPMMVVSNHRHTGALVHLPLHFNATHLNQCLQRGLPGRRSAGNTNGNSNGNGGQEPGSPDFVLTLEEFVARGYGGREGAAGEGAAGDTAVQVDRFLCSECPAGHAAERLWESWPPADILLPAPEPLPAYSEAVSVRVGPNETVSRNVSTMARFAAALSDIAGGKGGRIVMLSDQFFFNWIVRDIPPIWGFDAGLTGAWLGEGYGLDWNLQDIGAALPHGLPKLKHLDGSGDAAGSCLDWEGCSDPQDFCRSAVWPQERVVAVAEAVVRELLGRRFVAVHLRRSDFFHACVLRKECPYWSQMQAARCVAARLLAADMLADVSNGWGRVGTRKEARQVDVVGQMPAVYLATDLEEEQIKTFVGALKEQAGRLWGELRAANGSRHKGRITEERGDGERSIQEGKGEERSGECGGEALQVVRLPRNLNAFVESIHMWREKQLHMRERDGKGMTWLEQEGVDVILDKLICARASVFLGLPTSTFSADIMGMREAMGTASCLDGALCRGIPESKEWP